ncbi:hypothetical protein E6O75_ATG03135 [Venturia nashicola]|uniref:Uncharacterized protein n=1 Tax=Venturia nashicola TaxID=86259 RepID=A0A4Z1P978_9PEZI|nr:hypothetical protein E6O75_ATG03135 [Venturia nashicola]
MVESSPEGGAEDGAELPVPFDASEPPEVSGNGGKLPASALPSPGEVDVLPLLSLELDDGGEADPLLSLELDDGGEADPLLSLRLTSENMGCLALIDIPAIESLDPAGDSGGVAEVSGFGLPLPISIPSMESSPADFAGDAELASLDVDAGDESDGRLWRRI